MKPREELLARIEGALSEARRLNDWLASGGAGAVLSMAEVLAGVFRARSRLYVFGNGGSAADAQHLAAEFVNRFGRERRALGAVALTVDTSVITSITNDRSFAEVFSRQLAALAEPGDAALGITTSGRSENVLLALRFAREHGLHTLGFFGAAASDADIYCDLALHVPSPATPRVQECHITAGHLVCDLVEEMLFGEGGSDTE